jgi:hypothetical protein
MHPRAAVALAFASLAACSAHRGAAVQRDSAIQPGTGGSGLPQQAERLPPANRRYVDPQLGFEVAQPSGGDWQLDASGDSTDEGIAVPVILRHRGGAQVVVQVAPAIATPTQFAERLVSGLRGYQGFTATDPEPLPISDDAVGFRFTMEDRVRGRIAVRPGIGNVLMVVATWPMDASDGVRADVDQILVSVRPIPAS